MSAANTWSTAVLTDDDGRSVAVDVNGFALSCDVPVDPEPDPGEGQRAPRPRERLDPDAFDRARAEWEQPLKSSDGR